MTLGARPKVVKRCPNHHVMDMAWRTCPRCSGGRVREVVRGRGMTEQTMIFGAPPIAREPAPAPVAPDWVALLTATGGPMSGRAIEILPGRWKLGRAPRADGDVRVVTIPDPGLSREHFAIEAGVAAVILRDLNSTNGTFVNGSRVERHILREGDQVRAGESAFQVRLSLKASS